MLTRSARWFAIGVSIAPVLDTADDLGVLVSLDDIDRVALARALGIVVAFVSIAGVAARLFVHHRPVDRIWFFALSCTMVGAYVFDSGLRFSGVAAFVCLGLALMQLRAWTGVLGVAARGAPGRNERIG